MSSLDPVLHRAPEELSSVHLMGIGGTAMAALAAMLQEKGVVVRGSDNRIYPPMSDFLAARAITVHEGYRAENLEPAPDLVIVGNVITRNNPEAVALAASRLPYLSLPQALANYFLTDRHPIVVTGTHGKTTTASMLAATLFRMERDPCFMIGGIVSEFGTNFRIGGGRYFVVEGDEYDTAFFDKESKFLHYRPRSAIITSLEFDHADIFDSLAEIVAMFRKFIALLPTNGIIVAHGDDDNVRRVTAHAPCPVHYYGVGADNKWRLGTPVHRGGMTCCELFTDNRLFGIISIRLPGLHNCLNAAAVVALLAHHGFSYDRICGALEQFTGVKRRQEIRGTIGGITVIDDFAHHPTAVRETLAGLKQAYPDRRLIAVFEPRSNTSRRALFQDAYADSFASADLSIIREPAGDKPLCDGDIFSAATLVSTLATRGKHAVCCRDTDEILAFLTTELRPGDVVAICSNGGFDNIHERLLAQLRKQCG
ncbi:MAG: UDP-N-acetylmuramate:L-alanyl-gamma-D-glutamyl-meso-diaminopimelate ligase [Desulfofustis sp. PB-SRB1]|jgi:UDP-N-acetylmuramate: L-alanyl-gamma-D-glutamyl-meso-diaminopimelate ligase|nr:UDP-N-acetylmuramate:L-alanyl-gamma-D-glutamyl-meso-diaminopimelate ligase [Desulfofustis sp. PB-SRB1]MBM1000963.1 UDP-N-acetylmuramate:L-alanyl-gamma-D-glutamyl-meso-diaminopimelate ligase [Desulfofustis sp. PB-SRB1]HBH28545.1 UDP-N-acetylmuramate:L-alanyl-gamma-D-glutamyl-meso-diaminopimelate ligase [Desulfofustis sp.]HBH32889.1 UDP-N-acetylmuramate:L-alanyl-gamma-D-glutamyl-meso-diaminopimelate ligase [Desulfofustis sp.]